MNLTCDKDKFLLKFSKIFTNKTINLTEIREIVSNGLPNNKVRQKLWSFILELENIKQTNEETEIIHHKDTEQIKQDVDRCYWKESLKWSESKKEEERENLEKMVNQIMIKNGDLYYYQGFHEICSIIQVVYGSKKGKLVSEQIALHYIRDNMNKNFKVVLKYLHLIFQLIKHVDEELYEFLNEASMDPCFATSWVLTWFAHVVPDIDTVLRLFDFFIAEGPFMPYYFSAALVLYNNNLILNKCPPIMSEVFKFLQSLVFNMNVEDVILISQKLFKLFPPILLLNELDAKISQDFHFLNFSLFDSQRTFQNSVQFQNDFLANLPNAKNSSFPSIIIQSKNQNNNSLFKSFKNRELQLHKLISSKFEKDNPLRILISNRNATSFFYKLIRIFIAIIVLFFAMTIFV
ncbi:tbc1 domain family member 20/gtpase [Anaeramoeba ignava]|uniref:Tbc1 domain family member 20/gtpase n=1 Tax=Anaeramoeba ignava TaxID=1746090 RepID=A0A9Q0LNK4_ANAIG|nr:tbc1 domain family member 20/gtpase [Anaeramoeba ignava]|eukprot:Anaeramoba_ignava/a865_33.p1 GENE.a865_33~~a865_33.p1  ORF type:complete len:412 (+),score=105.26 a865_33:24-1238(+)